MDKYLLLTFDVEDWFQVENLKSCIPFSAWDSMELRVEKNVHLILDLLDSKKTQSAKSMEKDGSLTRANALTPSRPHAGFDSPHALRLTPDVSPKATFFILGWIAERLPHLVKEIVQRGHEVASHGYSHQLCHLSSTEFLREDFVKSKDLLEDLIGSPVNGYRAPSFSVNEEVINLLRENGYRYDSSFNSFGLNSRYGKLSLNGHETIDMAYPLFDGFFELPVSNLVMGNMVLPLAGGGFFRLIPFPLFRWGIRAILKKKSAYLFYFHPWELDPDQPRVEGTPRLSQFRHYLNLNKTASRLSKLITDFKDCRFVTCSQYLEEIKHVRT